MRDKIIDKLLSGKFLLTLMAGIVFMVTSITGRLGIDDIKTVVLVVIYAYFTKRSTNGGS